MFTYHRTKGFILATTDVGESNQLLTVFSRDFGKIDILGRAIRKTPAKLRSGAQLFYLVNLEFIEGRTYKTLTDVLPENKFINVRHSLGRLSYAYKMAEAVCETTASEEEDQKMFSLIDEVFIVLNQEALTRREAQLLHLYFEWKLLGLAGYDPELFLCLRCSKKINPGRIFFDAKRGGLAHGGCFSAPPKESTIQIAENEIKILRLIRAAQWSLVRKISVNAETLQHLNKIRAVYSEQNARYIRHRDIAASALNMSGVPPRGRRFIETGSADSVHT